MKGKISQVKDEHVQTELTSDVAAGATTIEVEDVSEISPSGQVALLFDVYSYTRDDVADQEVDELDLDDEPDPDVGTLTLATPTVRDYVADTRVIQYPVTGDRVAYVVLEDQQEEIPARVQYGTKLFDEIPTGTRDDPELAETVEITFRDGEWLVADLIGTDGPGVSRRYVEKLDPFVVTSTDEAEPDVVATLILEIPSSEHRLLFNASANLEAEDGVTLKLGFDDSGVDFVPGEFPLLTFYGGGYDGVTVGGHNAFTGPALVAPALAPINLRNGSITLPNGHETGNVVSEYFPTLIAPYNLEPPTPGLHILRLTAFLPAAVGAASVDTVRFWATVI